jgi:hypothetical protein
VECLQTVLFDISATLPMDGPLGSVLAGMFGYQDAPTVSVGAYLIYLVVALVMFFRSPPAPKAAHLFSDELLRSCMSTPASGTPSRLALGGSRLGDRDDRRRRPVLLRLATGCRQTQGSQQ